jgi:hypothetical protein
MAASPEWFARAEEATPEVMGRIALAASANSMSLQVRFLPQKAHWFLLDSLLLANRANREGMHANALSLTRQCFEAISVLELGLCEHREAESILIKWEADEMSPGKLRAWLEANVWPAYGTGLWTESWSIFMRQFAAALQPYAHYSTMLSQWQDQLLPDSGQDQSHKLLKIGPRAYDSQKATRITLMHAILTYVLGRIFLSGHKDPDLSPLVLRLGSALAVSRYLDGHVTDWSQQFWAMLWDRSGDTVLE